MMVFAPLPLHEILDEWRKDVCDSGGEVSTAERMVYHAAFRAACEHPEESLSPDRAEKAVFEGLRGGSKMSMGEDEAAGK
jgi:hypothetical protein